MIASDIAGLKVAHAGVKGFTAAAGIRSLASTGLKHCSHCKGLRGPCLCEYECPIPYSNRRKSQCFPVHRETYCGSCGTQSFQGSRFKCQKCSGFDLCEPCYEGGRHDNTHPFFHIAVFGKSPVLMKCRSDTSAAPPVPGNVYNHQLHSSVSSSASSSNQHNDIACDSCGVQPVAGNRFTCQDCDDFDLCHACYSTSTHKRSHAFALIATEGATPILLTKPLNVDEQAATEAPLQENNVREPHCDSSSSSNSIPRFVKGPSNRSDDGADSRPPNLMASSSSFSSSRLNQHSAQTSSFLDISCSSFSEPQSLSDSMPYASGCFRDSEAQSDKLMISAVHDSATYSIPVPTVHQNFGNDVNVLHRNAFCDGQKCLGATQGIVGPRYTCANCPPSLDLCQRCYSSQPAHNASHSFKRYDEADVAEFVMCPPQLQRKQQQQQQQPQQRQAVELHRTVFCDGPRCRGAKQGIIGARYTCANCPPSVDLCQSCYSSGSAHNPSHSFKRFDRAGVSSVVMCAPQLQQQQQQQQQPQEQQQARVLHRNVFCDGPRCRGAPPCIVGPRYTCADCPPSVDLCQSCYASRAAHDASHSFKRFDKAGVSSFVMCPPQLHEQQQQQQTRELHRSVFCDGPRCRGA